MKKIIVLLSFLTVGCGFPSPLEAIESTDNCLGPYSVEGIGTLNVDALHQNEKLLKQLLTHDWQYNGTKNALLHSGKEFCEAFGGIPIRIKTVEVFNCAGEECDGMYLWSKGIWLNKFGVSLLHEFIHVYETEHFVFNTNDHPNWDAKGYTYLGELYAGRSNFEIFK